MHFYGFHLFVSISFMALPECSRYDSANCPRVCNPFLFLNDREADIAMTESHAWVDMFRFHHSIVI